MEDSSFKSGCVLTSYSTIPVEDKLDSANIQPIHPVNIRLTTYSRHSSPSPLRLGTQMADSQHLPTPEENVLPKENPTIAISSRRPAQRSIPRKPQRHHRSVPYLTQRPVRMRGASQNNTEETMTNPLGHVPSQYVTRSTVQQPSPLTMMNLQQDSQYLTRSRLRLWKQRKSPCPQRIVAKEKTPAKTPTQLSTPKIPRSQLVQKMVSKATVARPKQSLSKQYAQSKSRSPGYVASPSRNRTVPMTRTKRRLLTDRENPYKAVPNERREVVDDADTKNPKQSGIMTRMRSLAASIQNKFTWRKKKDDDDKPTRKMKKKKDRDVTNSLKMETANAAHYVELPTMQPELQRVQSTESMDTSLPVSCFGSHSLGATKKSISLKRRSKEKMPAHLFKKPSQDKNDLLAIPMDIDMPLVEEKSTSYHPVESIVNPSAPVTSSTHPQTTPTNLMNRRPYPSSGKKRTPRFQSETKTLPTKQPTIPQHLPASVILNEGSHNKPAVDKWSSLKVLSPSPVISVPNSGQGMSFTAEALSPRPISSPRNSPKVSVPLLISPKLHQTLLLPPPSPTSLLLSSSSPPLLSSSAPCFNESSPCSQTSQLPLLSPTSLLLSSSSPSLSSSSAPCVNQSSPYSQTSQLPLPSPTSLLLSLSSPSLSSSSAPCVNESSPCSVKALTSSLLPTTEKLQSSERETVTFTSSSQISTTSLMATTKQPESFEQLGLSKQQEPMNGSPSSMSESTPEGLKAVDLISTASLISAAIRFPLQDEFVSSVQSDCLPNETPVSVPQISSQESSEETALIATVENENQQQEESASVSQIPVSQACSNADVTGSRIDTQVEKAETLGSPSFDDQHVQSPTTCMSTTEMLHFQQQYNSIAEEHACKEMPSALSQRINYSLSRERMISGMDHEFKDRPSCMYEDSTFLQPNQSMAIQEILPPLSVVIPEYNYAYGTTSFGSTMLSYYKHLGNFNTSFLQYGTRNPVMTQTALPRFQTQPTISTWYSNLQEDPMHWSHSTQQTAGHSDHYPDLLCHESLDHNDLSSLSTMCKESITQTDLSIPSETSLPVLSMSDLVDGGIDLDSTKKIPSPEKSSTVIKEWSVSSKMDSQENSTSFSHDQPSKIQNQTKKTYLVIPSVRSNQCETPLDTDLHSMQKSIRTSNSKKRLFEEYNFTDTSCPDTKKQKTSHNVPQQSSSTSSTSTSRKSASPQPAWTENCSDCAHVESILEESPYTLLNNIHCVDFTRMSTRDVIREYCNSRCFYRSIGKPHLLTRDLVWRLFTVAELHGNRVNSLNPATIEAIHQTVLEKSQCGEQIWRKKCIPFVNCAIRNFFSVHFRKYWNLLGHRCDPSVC